MDNQFQFLMIGAMYENGGNTTQRFLDGHPELYVYPFESQVGTRLVNDQMSSLFPVKYRWPVFSLDASPLDDYKSFIDEECKIRARTPAVSKFRHVQFDFSDDERCARYLKIIEGTGRSRANNISAFFRATFEAWKDYKRSGKEKMYVGYSPIIVIDAEKILRDFPNSHVLHVVRNPWSAYADTKKRAVPLSLHSYMVAWIQNQYHALLYRELFPGRLHVIRTEDIMANPEGVLGTFCEKLGLEKSSSLSEVSWNGRRLEEVYPWGTIRKASPEANKATALELSSEEKELIRIYADSYLETFDYKNFFGP